MTNIGRLARLQGGGGGEARSDGGGGEAGQACEWAGREYDSPGEGEDTADSRAGASVSSNFSWPSTHFQGADLDNVNMDEAAVKKILLGFEKKVSRNQEMRIKFPDQPDKFMVSEMELHDVVRELQNVSTVPHFYPIMVVTFQTRNISTENVFELSSLNVNFD